MKPVAYKAGWVGRAENLIYGIACPLFLNKISTLTVWMQRSKPSCLSITEHSGGILITFDTLLGNVCKWQWVFAKTRGCGIIPHIRCHIILLQSSKIRQQPKTTPADRHPHLHHHRMHHNILHQEVPILPPDQGRHVFARHTLHGRQP